MDQIDTAIRLVDRSHVLLTGETLHGFHAQLGADRVLRLAAQVTQEADEIWERPITRCYLIEPNGTYASVIVEGHR